MKNLTSEQEKELMVAVWDPRIAEDPYAFVMMMFPWGKPNTPLEKFKGPRKWQERVLKDIALHIKESKNTKEKKVFRLAVSSGRGIGKSALVAWLTYWMMSVNIGSSTIVTANTEQQLKSRTWAELGKWHAMALNEHWFEKMALSLKPASWFEKELKDQLNVDTGYYYAQAQLWSEENPDAFAGAHNMNGIMLIMDEASGIPECIWKVCEGFFTEPVVYRFWFVFSNPRNNTGAFFECFNKNRNYWSTKTIDSRDVEGTDIAIYEKIIEQYGEDSDVARVEVRGMFPSQGDGQFIARGDVDEAIGRELVVDQGAPLIMGVDVARMGDDVSVIAFRRGRDATVVPWRKYKRVDTTTLVGYISELADQYDPDAIFVDGGGVGGPVVDMLKDTRYKVIEVQFGGKPNDVMSYMNKRTEMWARMRDWLRVGKIPDDVQLVDDLMGPRYSFSSVGQMKLESKEEMKRRGYASPDHGDALAVTFAKNVARHDMATVRRRRMRNYIAKGAEYDVLSYREHEDL